MRDPFAVFHNAKTGESIIQAGDEHVDRGIIDVCGYPLLPPAPV